MAPQTITPSWPQLALAARRGNAEAEQLLAPFINQLRHQTELCNQHADTLMQLLNSEEQDLLNWLLNPHQAPPQWRALIARIRHSYQQSL